MDSWFDVFLRIILFSGIISIVIFVIKNKNNREEVQKWQLYDDETMLSKMDEENPNSKPSGPPPPGSFG